MGAWGDVILGAEFRGNLQGPENQKANYVTIMLREWMANPGVLECKLTVYGDTDSEFSPYDLTSIKMTAEGLRKLAESAISSAHQMNTYGDDDERHTEAPPLMPIPKPWFLVALERSRIDTTYSAELQRSLKTGEEYDPRQVYNVVAWGDDPETALAAAIGAALREAA